MTSKLVEYAYPTSTHATKAGFGSTGCWFVRLYPSVESTIGGKIVKDFANQKEAMAYAEAMPNPWNWMIKYARVG